MQPKFKMSREENVFVAKRNLVDYIYNSAKLEGCNVTFPETQTILDGVNVGNVTLDDIQTILNLRDAWRFVLSSLDQPFDVDYICRVNDFVSRRESLQWGVLRTGRVGISGTNYEPPVPVRQDVERQIAQILSAESATERAINYFLWACRAQLFWDGNKRISTVCANKILIAAGEGILTVRDADVLTFNQLLLQFYNTGDPSEIKPWLYEHSIDGIDFPQQAAEDGPAPQQ